jgi:hypothetical protein
LLLLGLQGGVAVAILRVRFTARLKSQGNQCVDVAVPSPALQRSEKKEVDDEREKQHNLTSLLLTNKTIRKRSKAVPNTVL